MNALILQIQVHIGGYLSNILNICNIPYTKNIKFKRNFARYIKRYTTPKGTICLSKSEYIITCWLEDKNIKFHKEIYYKDFLKGDTTKRKIDWIIDHNDKLYHVEFFGLYANKLYRKRADKKIQDCKDNNINLIAIMPQDLKNKTMEEIFSFLK